LTLYPISLDTSIRNNTDNVNANSCQGKITRPKLWVPIADQSCRWALGWVKRMTSVTIGLQNLQNRLIAVFAIAVFWVLCTGATQAPAKQPLFDGFKRIIVLDPGHGGHEFGARGPDGTLEKAVALTLARMIAAELEREYKVVLTRTDDYRVDLNNRAALANHLRANLFISLHTGGSFIHSTAGTIIYYYQNVSETPPTHEKNPSIRGEDKNTPIRWDHVQSRYQEKSRTLARMINTRLDTINSIKKIRIQGAPLAVLQGADMPAILIEVGYLTNPAEEKNLRDHRFLTDLTIEISRGINDFFSQKNQ